MSGHDRKDEASVGSDEGRKSEAPTEAECDDVASLVSSGRGAQEADSIEEEESSDREAVREDLHESAKVRQAEAVARDQEVGFGRQMIQLALIPALIVGAVMGVWLLIVALTGRSQSLESIMTHLEAVPRMEDGVGSVVGRPSRQQTFRDALLVAGILGGDDLTPEVRDDVRVRLEALAARHAGGDAEFLSFLMKSLGTIADGRSFGVFENLLDSRDSDDQYAALLGLYNWEAYGDIAEVRSLTGKVVSLLRSDDVRTRTMAASVLAGVASPDDMEARDALAASLENTAVENREVVWNAGCALAALGDERGNPVVLSLLDRGWLAKQPDDERLNSGLTLSEGAQEKLMRTVLNVLVKFVVGYDDDQGGGGGKAGHFVVRVDDQVVWDRVRMIAEDDPSESVRALAKRVLGVKDGEG